MGDGDDVTHDSLLEALASAPAHPMAVEARVLDERFELLERVGAGGMGTVMRAHDRASGATVAVKLLHDLADAGRVSREVTALKTLEDDAVVRYVDQGATAGGEVFLVMEWLDGRDLASRIDERPLTVEESVTLGRRLCEGLSAIHGAGLVHRDLKPHNVVLVDDDVSRATIVDLGLARRMLGASRLTRSGAVLGTVGYMAPEQARGERTLDAACDLFALGCVLQEALTGAPAFRGTTPAAVLCKVLLEEASPLGDRVPASLATLVSELLDKDPSKRPSDAAAVGRRLATVDLRGAPSKPAARPMRDTEQRLTSALMVAPAVDADAPTQLAEIADARPVAEVAARFGGTALGLAGETVLVRFDEEGSASEGSSRAALCALAIVEALPNHRVSLVLGRADDAGTLGESLDRAAELLEATTSGRVAIDETSAGLLGSRFEVSERGDVHVLRGELGSAERGGRLLLGKCVPCVGRRKELAFLRAALEETVEEGATQVVVISADAGVGKSRLAAELRAEAEGVRVLMATTGPLSRGSSGAVAAQLVAATVGSERPTSERIEAHLRELGVEDATDHAQFLAERFGAPPAEPGRALALAQERGPGPMAERSAEAFVALLEAEARSRPMLIVLEDAQWADTPSLRYLARFADEAPAALLLALTRPEARDVVLETFEAQDPDVVDLKVLSDGAAGRLVRAALGDPEDRIVDALVARAAGNAFFLEELVRASAAGRGVLPDSVRALVEDRILLLGRARRRALRAASVFGERAWVGGVARVLGLDGGEALRLLDGLVEDELMTRSASSRLPGQLELTCRHAILRDAAYAMLPDAERPAAHRLAAAWLEEAGEERAGVMVEHWERAGDRDAILKWRIRAAEDAYAVGDHTVLCAQVDRIRELEPPSEALGQALVYLGVSCILTASYGEAAQICREAALVGPEFRSFGMAGALATSVFADDRAGFAASLAGLGARPEAISGRYAALALQAAVTGILLGVGAAPARPYVRRLREVEATTDPDDWEALGWAASGRCVMNVVGEDRVDLPYLHGRLALLREMRDRLVQQTLMSLATLPYLQLGQLDAQREQAAYLERLSRHHPTWLALPYTSFCLSYGVAVHDPEAYLGEVPRLLDEVGEDEQAAAFVRAFEAVLEARKGRPDRVRELAAQVRRASFVLPKSVAEAAVALSLMLEGDAERAFEHAAGRRRAADEEGAGAHVISILDEVLLRGALAGLADPVPLARRAKARCERWASYAEHMDPEAYRKHSWDAKVLWPLIRQALA